MARTARRDNPEALQGFHGEHLAFLIDEASGIAEEVFEVAEGALSTPGALVVLAGNPTRLDGAFHRAFHSDRTHWTTFHFPSDESPLVDESYATRMAARYGRDSDIYRVRVAGEFPTAEPDTLVSLSLVEAAGRVAAAALAERPALIFVDVVGLGAGVVDRLREQRLPVYPVNVAERPADPQRFDDLRSELWWRVRDWLESGAAALPADEELAGQLATVKYGVTSAGRIRVESKQERKRRGFASPDRGDALMMTFAAPAAGLPPEIAAQHGLREATGDPWGRARRTEPFDRELGF